jgi:hypothetical protein
MIPGADNFPSPPFDAFNPVMEACAVKAVMGTAAGWGMGIMLGLFMGALGGEMNQAVRCGTEALHTFYCSCFYDYKATVIYWPCVC